MMQLAEDAHFVEVDAFVPFAVFSLHFFDCDYLSGLFVEAFGDAAEAAIAQFVAQLILLHSNYIQLQHTQALF